ncbi:hypothetical protein [Sulfurospirillum barnesii]|uniref:Peptidase C51 domain-containing protein n=1 Tax=Sulfurospirillum barnesii (strain ATCC 700032 / DSM 10660 / SES-3) TaxID=760154 RepID=I3XXX3_SULBS|nr:hypothetical protein [Sulfurospirillum barnesii]AFL68797.1 hypothetical protein Sulba_1509 [Sulfurospirillum barnesii SES-3]
MNYYFTLSLSALLLCGCAMKEVEVPSQIVEAPKPEAKMYIEEKPTKELLLKQEKESFALRSIPERSTREAIVENAMMYLGKRDGGDCSGFVNLINIRSGRPFYQEKELSQSFDNARKSRAMFNLMSKKGNAYEARLPHIGDLVFFENTERRTSKKTKGNKTPAVQVAENITHVGIVTKVESDGTVEFIHHSNGKNILDYMNFNYPMLTNKDGKKINTYMKRCPSKNGAVQPQCMNIAFFVAYGTF